MMSVSRLLSRWRADPTIGDQIAAWHTFTERQAKYSPFPENIDSGLIASLRSGGIQSLYQHQHAAWNAVQQGEHLLIATGTASGKSLCYQLPILNQLIMDPDSRSLLIFPTKSLAQDQASSLRSWISQIPAGPLTRLVNHQDVNLVSTYDGDTPSQLRPTIRQHTNIVITNPDMLHTGILPHHTNWAAFFQHLRFIVIDEIHVYRGVFGSHIANLIRRIRRIARFYANAPQFIMASATIGNPLQLAEKLIEAPVTLIEEDTSGRGAQHFLIYNPPIINPDLGLRRSALQEASRLCEDLLTYQVQTLIFARSRRSVEIVLTYLRQRLHSTLPDLEQILDLEGKIDPAEVVRGYRSGYLPRQRREIEAGLRTGQLRAVVATNALELGIDIGGMGAAVLVGFPGSIAATRQQAGRAGRGSDTSLAVLVATADPLDQYLARHSEYLFTRNPEHALINPDNLTILLDHLRCAAFELPFHENESFGAVPQSVLVELLEFLVQAGLLHFSDHRYFWMADQYPSQFVSLRSISAASVLLEAEKNGSRQTIGEVDGASATWLVHPGAIYLHDGVSYLVENLDLENNLAELKRLDTDYYTTSVQETHVQLIHQQMQKAVPGGEAAFGEIQVTRQLVGFRQVRWVTHEQLGFTPLEMPSSDLLTSAYWLALSEECVTHLESQSLWRSSPLDYGPNWSVQRERARQRDGYRCQVCGQVEDKHAHDVHHKIPFRSVALSQPTSNVYEIANRLDNLVTLCPRCHRRAETSVRVRSGLAGLAYTLGHLAPLFLMCDSKDLGVYSDAQALISNGKPAIVIYDQIPDGLGFSERLYEVHLDLIAQAQALILDCPCLDGCPSCVGPGGEQGMGGKEETMAILNILLKS